MTLRIKSRPTTILAAVATATAGLMTLDWTLSKLETQYPNLPAEKRTSRALQSPGDPSRQRCAYIDTYATKIPVRLLERKALLSSKQNNDSSLLTREDLQRAWVEAVMGSRVMRARERFFSTPSNDPDSIPGLTIVRGFGKGEEEFTNYGYLLSWEMPRPACEFFESAAHYGYPWRLMSGGRHEIGVASTDDNSDDDDDDVEVRFVSAHDYEIVPDEGHDQKVIPKWVGRLHSAYARVILDQAVHELHQAYGEGT